GDAVRGEVAATGDRRVGTEETGDADGAREARVPGTGGQPPGSRGVAGDEVGVPVAVQVTGPRDAVVGVPPRAVDDTTERAVGPLQEEHQRTGRGVPGRQVGAAVA